VALPFFDLGGGHAVHDAVAVPSCHCVVSSRCQIEPLVSLDISLWRAATLNVNDPKTDLSIRVALLSQLAHRNNARLKAAESFGFTT
jgi:predicted ATP-dependent serine protease